MLAVLDILDALGICRTNFPRGPEKLADQLRVVVEYFPLHGCEGWCVHGDSAIVCINSNSPPVRQRFTLAHELAHLLLHTATDVSFLGDLGFTGDDEERSVNNLAAQMLLPAEVIREFVGQAIPIRKETVHGIAKAAGVSELMTVLRLQQLSENLSIKDSFVADFGRERNWQLPRGACPSHRATELLKLTSESTGGEYAYDIRDRENLAMLFSTDWSQTLFVQSVERPR
jgi:Zn-dependent peptidase ImmA (M78 family)